MTTIKHQLTASCGRRVCTLQRRSREVAVTLVCLRLTTTWF